MPKRKVEPTSIGAKKLGLAVRDLEDALGQFQVKSMRDANRMMHLMNSVTEIYLEKLNEALEGVFRETD